MKTLYVGNLSYGPSAGALPQAFDPYGGTNARIIEGRGFGFIDVEAVKMEQAIADKHNTQLDGRTLTVNEARPKSDNRSGGGGGGGGYGGGRSGGGGYGGGGGGRSGGGGRGGRW